MKMSSRTFPEEKSGAVEGLSCGVHGELDEGRDGFRGGADEFANGWRMVCGFDG